MVMVTCPKCGAETQEDHKFCSVCGASLEIQPKPAETKPRVRQRDTCFGEGERDYLGLVSVGFFIIIVAIVFLSNVNIFEEFRQWIDLMTTRQTFVRPSDGLLSSAKLLFILAGISNFVMAGIRMAFSDVKNRIISDALSGVALVLFAYFIQLYAARSITWAAALGYEAIAVGLLVMLYSALWYMLKRPK
jgi:hypothetical protein